MSEQHRAEGNELFRSAQVRGLAKVLQRSRLASASDAYSRAVHSARTQMESASALKNKGIAQRDLCSVLLSGDTIRNAEENVQLVHHFVGGIDALLAAKALGMELNLAPAWLEVVDQSLLRLEALLLQLFIAAENGGGAHLCYEDSNMLSTMLRQLRSAHTAGGAAVTAFASLALGGVSFKHAVTLFGTAETDCLASLSQTVDCMQHLRQAQSLVARHPVVAASFSRHSIADAAQAALEGAQQHENICRSVQQRIVGELTLARHMADTERPDFDMAWTVADMYKVRAAVYTLVLQTRKTPH
jgi:hypothetical protein